MYVTAVSRHTQSPIRSCRHWQHKRKAEQNICWRTAGRKHALPPGTIHHLYVGASKYLGCAGLVEYRTTKIFDWWGSLYSPIRSFSSPLAPTPPLLTHHIFPHISLPSFHALPPCLAHRAANPLGHHEKCPELSVASADFKSRCESRRCLAYILDL